MFPKRKLFPMGKTFSPWGKVGVLETCVLLRPCARGSIFSSWGKVWLFGNSPFFQGKRAWGKVCFGISRKGRPWGKVCVLETCHHSQAKTMFPGGPPDVGKKGKPWEGKKSRFFKIGEAMAESLRFGTLSPRLHENHTSGRIRPVSANYGSHV